MLRLPLPARCVCRHHGRTRRRQSSRPHGGTAGGGRCAVLKFGRERIIPSDVMPACVFWCECSHQAPRKFESVPVKINVRAPHFELMPGESMHVVCCPVKSLTHDYHLGLAARVRSHFFSTPYGWLPIGLPACMHAPINFAQRRLARTSPAMRSACQAR